MNALYAFKQRLDNNEPCAELLEQCITEFGSSKKHAKGFFTLILRYYILIDNVDMVIHVLYGNTLMKRDYITCLEYFMMPNYADIHYDVIVYIYSMIKEITTTDVDTMIRKNWRDLLKQFDGYPVMCSLKKNVADYSIFTKYDFDVSAMRTKYVDRIERVMAVSGSAFDAQIGSANLLIDGANLSHSKTTFDFSILPHIIIKLQSMGYSPKIILHERHVVKDKNLSPYLIRTPTGRNDDDFMLYGMLKFNTMVLSNDLFRDHLKDMDVWTCCFVQSMTMRYRNDSIIVPLYSKCVQIIGSDIYVPCFNGFYKMIC